MAYALVAVLLVCVVMASPSSPAVSRLGRPLLELLLFPAAVAGAVVPGPVVEFLAFAAKSIVGVFVLYRIAGAGRLWSLDHRRPARGAWSPDGLLRRRCVAGEPTYQEFQDGKFALLTARYARGDLTLAEYELELEKLLQPARYLDVTGDPAIAAARAR
jgi:hypothetical protein